MDDHKIIFSFIIPAYNEEEFIARTIESLKMAMKACGAEGEIIVVDNDSDDATAEMAASHGAKVVKESMRQIARARNCGAEHAQGDHLIFIDADTELNPELFKRTLECMADPNIVGGGTTLQLDQGSPSAQKFTGMWNSFSKRFKLAAGCYIFCERQAFEELKGFNEKVFASEEIWFMKRLRKLAQRRGGELCIIDDAPITTSARKLEWFSPTSMMIQLMLFFFFPFLCRYRMFCFMWYRRPQSKG
jgi:glycosyltransferase involved in cell wall biosynthesis